MIVLIALGFAWQQRSIDQLRKEVKSISGKVQVEDPKGKAKNESPDLVTALAKAEKHTKRAKELMEKNRTKEAQAEIEYALRSLRSAHEVSSSIVGDAAEAFGKARENAENVFKKAWKDISEEVTTKKKGQ